MFGIGFEELFIIAIVLLLAVGPDKMPTFVKAVGKGLREFRKATRDLRSSVGLDELLRDEDLRQLRQPLSVPQTDRRPAHTARYTMTDEDREREYPPEGVDLKHVEERGGGVATAPPSAVEVGAKGPDPLEGKATTDGESGQARRSDAGSAGSEGR